MQQLVSLIQADAFSFRSEQRLTLFCRLPRPHARAQTNKKENHNFLAELVNFLS
jgi:hypothetical protein